MSYKDLTGKNINLADTNGMWKADKVGMAALHEWVRKRLPKPERCDMCQIAKPIDLANKGIYDRELQNWEWLCRVCHMKSDGRMAALVKFNNARKIPDIKCMYCDKTFSPGNSTKKYCSISCGLSGSNQKRVSKRECVVCNSIFTGYPARLTCSLECRNERKAQQQRTRREPRNDHTCT